MQEENKPTGDGVAQELAPPPCKFKTGDWVALNASSKSLRQFEFMKKDDIGIVMDVSYTKKPRRYWNYNNIYDEYYLLTVYWQNSSHRKTGHQVKLKERRLKFANRKRKQN